MLSSTAASSAASQTGYCLAHQYNKTIHFRNGNLDLEKKDLSQIVLVFLHWWQYQVTPSEISLRALFDIASPPHLFIYVISYVQCKYVILLDLKVSKVHHHISVYICTNQTSNLVCLIDIIKMLITCAQCKNWNVNTNLVK